MIQVLRFTAPWCAPCKMLKPVMEEIATQFTDVKFETIDVDENPDMAQHFKVRSVPTVLIMNDRDETLFSFVGIQSKHTYIESIKSSKDNSNV